MKGSYVTHSKSYQIINKLPLLTMQAGEVVGQQSILPDHQPTVFTNNAIRRSSWTIEYLIRLITNCLYQKQYILSDVQPPVFICQAIRKSSLATFNKQYHSEMIRYHSEMIQ